MLLLSLLIIPLAGIFIILTTTYSKSVKDLFSTGLRLHYLFMLAIITLSFKIIPIIFMSNLGLYFLSSIFIGVTSCFIYFYRKLDSDKIIMGIKELIFVFIGSIFIFFIFQTIIYYTVNSTTIRDVAYFILIPALQSISTELGMTLDGGNPYYSIDRHKGLTHSMDNTYGSSSNTQSAEGTMGTGGTRGAGDPNPNNEGIPLDQVNSKSYNPYIRRVRDDSNNVALSHVRFNGVKENYSIASCMSDNNGNVVTVTVRRGVSKLDSETLAKAGAELSSLNREFKTNCDLFEASYRTARELHTTIYDYYNSLHTPRVWVKTNLEYLDNYRDYKEELQRKHNISAGIQYGN